MNAYAWILLAALAGELVLDVVARLLNLGTMRGEMPPELAGVYDRDRSRAAQAYAREATRFGLVVHTAELAALLAFWWGGGFAALDRAVRNLGWPDVPTGLAFIGTLVLLRAVLALPADLWSTFVLEERHGFNRTTPRTFVLDRLKGAAVAVLLGGPVLALVLYAFERAGNVAWLWGWGMVAAATIAAQLVFPIWILPLFHRFEALGPGELRDAIERYAQRVGFELSGIFVVDGSRRSSRANAFFTGFGKTRRVALFDTLVEKHPVPELVAVLAHEVGHARGRHLPKGLVLGILHAGVLFALLQLFLGSPGLFQAFGVERPSTWAGLVFFSLLYAPIELALSVGLFALARRFEREADRFAVDTAPDPAAMAAALRRLAADNLVHPSPHPFYTALRSSHPPVAERIRAIQERIAAHRPATAIAA